MERHILVKKTSKSIRMLCSMALLITILLLHASLSHAKKVHRVKTPAPERYAAIVVDAETGQVLHQQNAGEPRFPASLTKIMTLYMVFEALDTGKLSLQQPITVSRNATQKEPSRLGLKAGDTITVENAILALVTKSANDMATVLAEAVAGDEKRFCRMMTERAHSLGMHDSIFTNPSGLPDPGQKTTASDLARLSLAVLKHYPHYYYYFNTRNFLYDGRKYHNHNHLLKAYPGLDGIKTGFIRASGFNLVASAVRKGKRIVAVVMGGQSARSRDLHMMRVLNSAFYKLGIVE